MKENNLFPCLFEICTLWPRNTIQRLWAWTVASLQWEKTLFHVHAPRLLSVFQPVKRIWGWALMETRSWIRTEILKASSLRLPCYPLQLYCCWFLASAILRSLNWKPGLTLPEAFYHPSFKQPVNVCERLLLKASWSNKKKTKLSPTSWLGFLSCSSGMAHWFSCFWGGVCVMIDLEVSRKGICFLLLDEPPGSPSVLRHIQKIYHSSVVCYRTAKVLKNSSQTTILRERFSIFVCGDRNSMPCDSIKVYFIRCWVFLHNRTKTWNDVAVFPRSVFFICVFFCFNDSNEDPFYF